MIGIIREYGRTWLTAMLAVAVTLVFISDMRLIGNAASKYTGEEDNIFCEDEYGKEKTSFEADIGNVKAGNMALCNRTYRLSDLYSYFEGEISEARIISVTKAEGFDLTDRICPDGKHLTFFDKGVYSLRVCIWNSEGVRSMRRIYVGVEG
ncbi:MAG: hypothetical protein K6F00_06030 [Lachnospiraceae bacterium]|nr:hypothetical protein [Lachnospiraceae bacterium]